MRATTIALALVVLTLLAGASIGAKLTEQVSKLTERASVTNLDTTYSESHTEESK